MKKIDRNGFWTITSNPISKVGIFPYLGSQIDSSLEADKVYMVLRPAEELFNQEALDSFNTVPVPLVDEHTMLGEEYTPAEKKGIDGVVQNIRQDGDVLVGDIAIYSEEMKEKITRGKKELSMGYFCTYDIQEGEYNGEHYDAIQRNIRSNHIALVDRGRCGHDVRVFDKWCFDCAISNDVEFVESEHPRHKDGKFAPKGQGVNKFFSKIENTIDPIRIENINESEKNAVREYTNELSITSYKGINQYLRTGDIDKSFLNPNTIESKIHEIKDTIKQLDSLTNKGVFQYDLKLSRGTDLHEFESILTQEEIENANLKTIQKKLIGKQYKAKGFTSTSISTDDNKFTKSRQVNMEITAPAGTQGVSISGLSSFYDEYEILLKRGTEFKITNVERKKGKGQFIIHAEIIPDKKITPEPLNGNLVEKFKKNRNRTDFSEDFKPIESLLEKYPNGAKEIANIVAFEFFPDSENDNMRTYLFEDSYDLRNLVDNQQFSEIFNSLNDTVSKIIDTSDLEDITLEDIESIERNVKENPTSMEARNEYEYLSDNLDHCVPKNKIIPTISSIFKKYNIDFPGIIDKYKSLQTATDAQFEESKHPRHKDGKFAKKGEGQSNLQKTIEKYTGGKFARKGEGQSNLQKAIENYTGGKFGEINEYLRGYAPNGKSLFKSSQERSDTIKSLISLTSNPIENQNLTRLSKADDFSSLLTKDQIKQINSHDFKNINEIRNSLVGKRFTNQAFTSTSKEEKKGNSKWLDNSTRPVKWEIEAPEGTLGADLSESSMQNKLGNNENEVLLAPQTSFVITGVYDPYENYDRLYDKLEEEWAEEINPDTEEYYESIPEDILKSKLPDKDSLSENPQLTVTVKAISKKLTDQEIDKIIQNEPTSHREQQKTEENKSEKKETNKSISENDKKVFVEKINNGFKDIESYIQAIETKKLDYTDEEILRRKALSQFYEVVKELEKYDSMEGLEDVVSFYYSGAIPTTNGKLFLKALKDKEFSDKHKIYFDEKEYHKQKQLWIDAVKKFEVEKEKLKKSLKNTASDSGCIASKDDAIVSQSKLKELRKMIDREKLAALKELVAMLESNEPVATQADEGEVEEKKEALSVPDISKSSEEENSREEVEEEDKDEDDIEKEKEENLQKSEDSMSQKIFSMLADRDNLAKKVTPIIGGFDYSKMTVDQVAKYACDKLDISTNSPMATINGYLKGYRKSEMYSMDTATKNIQTTNSQIEAYLKGE